MDRGSRHKKRSQGHNFAIKLYEKYKMRNLTYSVGSKTSWGYYYRFNFLAHAQKRFYDTLFEIGKENGFSKEKMRRMLIKKTGTPVSNVNWSLNGTHALRLWEIDILAKAVGIEVVFKKCKTGDERYRVKEEGLKNELLILQSLDFPRFHIRFKKDNLYDFNVDFSQDQHLRFVDASRRGVNDYFRHVKDLCDWYFIRVSEKKKLPFDVVRFKALFIEKFAKNETHHVNTSAKKDEAKWEEEIIIPKPGDISDEELDDDSEEFTFTD